jgi:hypothetical protein
LPAPPEGFEPSLPEPKSGVMPTRPRGKEYVAVSLPGAGRPILPPELGIGPRPTARPGGRGQARPVATVESALLVRACGMAEQCDPRVERVMRDEAGDGRGWHCSRCRGALAVRIGPCRSGGNDGHTRTKPVPAGALRGVARGHRPRSAALPMSLPISSHLMIADSQVMGCTLRPRPGERRQPGGILRRLGAACWPYLIPARQSRSRVE